MAYFVVPSDLARELLATLALGADMRRRAGHPPSDGLSGLLDVLSRPESRGVPPSHNTEDTIDAATHNGGLMTRTEAAKFAAISVSALDDLARCGTVTPIYVGRSVRYHPARLLSELMGEMP